MAEQGGGAYTFIANDGDGSASLARYREWLTRPYLTQLEIDWGALPVGEWVPEIPRDLFSGQNLTVIAWLWARTVKSPNPAFANVDVPLASSFMLSTKPGKEAYVEPLIEGASYRFTVRLGKPQDTESATNGRVKKIAKTARATSLYAFGTLRTGSRTSSARFETVSTPV